LVCCFICFNCHKMLRHVPLLHAHCSTIQCAMFFSWQWQSSKRLLTMLTTWCSTSTSTYIRMDHYNSTSIWVTRAPPSLLA
jgi:hypothetical protein